MIEVRPYEQNAKLHPQKQLLALAAIVKEVGWRQAILVNGQGVIVAGHGRWATWMEYGQEYGLKEPWVINDRGETLMGGPETEPLTAEQEIAYRLADNKLNESAWNMKLVIPELRTLTAPLLNLTGFSPDLLLEEDEKDDLIPALGSETNTKIGDHYQLGEHHLIVGDATNKETVAKLAGNQKMDMVFTDPPYNINYKGGGKNTSNHIENDNMETEAFVTFLEAAFKNYAKVVKQGAGLYIFHDAKTASSFEKALDQAGFEVKTHLIWNKPSAGLGMGDYRRKHEPFMYACLKGAKPNFYGGHNNASVIDFQKTEDQLYAWAKKQKKREKEGKLSIWSVNREFVGDYVHPTQKPVELITYALANSSKEGDLVMDLFLGSGSTMIACEKANRVCYGMELDPRYADVIIERWCQYVGKRDIIKNNKPIVWQTK